MWVAGGQASGRYPGGRASGPGLGRPVSVRPDAQQPGTRGLPRCPLPEALGALLAWGPQPSSLEACARVALLSRLPLLLSWPSSRRIRSAAIQKPSPLRYAPLGHLHPQAPVGTNLSSLQPAPHGTLGLPCFVTVESPVSRGAQTNASPPQLPGVPALFPLSAPEAISREITPDLASPTRKCYAAFGVTSCG